MRRTRSRRRLPAIVVAVAVLIAAFPPATAAGQDAGKPFSVAMTGKYPPFSFTGDDGQVAGFDVDVSRAVASRLGRDCEIIRTDWDGILAGLLAGKYDAIIGSMAITPPRQEQVDFSQPYYVSGAQLFVRADDKEIRGIDDCAGKRIGAVVGETYQRFLQTNYPQVKLASYDSSFLIFQELQNGNLDGFVSDKLVGLWQIKAAGKPFVPAGDLLYKERMGIPVTKGNGELLKQINAALADMRATGELDGFHEKWFGSTAAHKSSGMSASVIARLLAKGFAISLLVAALSIGLGFIASVPAGVVLNNGRGALYAVARAAVDFIRGTPVLIQLLFVYFGLQYLGVRLSPISAAVVTLSINSAAYMSEVIRSGLMSVNRGQRLAGRALGLGRVQVFCLIVWPQAFRIAMPPLMNSVVALIKDTALVSIISVTEVVFEMRSIVSATFNPSYYVVVAIMFFAVTFPLMKLAGMLEARMKARGFAHD